MPHNEDRITHIVIKVNGSDLPTSTMDQLEETVIDSTLDMPDMVVCSFHDEELELVDGNTFPLGALIEIELSHRDDPQSTTPVFKGEIISLEPNFNEGTRPTLTVRGYDKSYRLHRETKTKAWLSVKDSDIAQQIAGSAGLGSQVDSTSEVFKHVFQNALTDMAFLRSRAERIGYEVFVRDEKLYFRKPDLQGNDADLEYGVDLLSFFPRLTVADQVNEVTVKGWDAKKKEAITGKATSSNTHPNIGLGQWGGSAASSAVSSAGKIEVREPVQSQADADAVAKSLLDEINGGFIEAEGTALGVPTLKAGMVINLTKIGEKFSGKYKLTSIRHVYSPEGFVSHFTVEGSRPQLLMRLLDQQQSNAWAGVVPAIVTNNNDSENDWGSVKIKYPWLADSEESFWARLAAPGIGADRGIYFMPEINDEVLVAFEHGDFNRPYIIGGLFNGKDKPAEAVGQAVAGGKVKTRIIRTRTGHVIRFVDEDSGEEYIEVVDAKQNTSIKMDTVNKKITITSKQDIDINADGNISLSAKKDISIKAQGKIDIGATRDLTMDGSNAKLNAKLNCNIEAKGNMSVKGSTFSAEGMTTAELKGNAMLTLRGGIVNIN